MYLLEFLRKILVQPCLTIKTTCNHDLFRLLGPFRTQVLEASTLSNGGLDRCGINTLAPVGTTFNITFYVWDSQQSRANASVIRTVTIAEPCPQPSLHNFCEAPDGRQVSILTAF